MADFFVMIDLTCLSALYRLASGLSYFFSDEHIGAALTNDVLDEDS